MVELTRKITRDRNLEANEDGNKTSKGKNDSRINKQFKLYSKIRPKTMFTVAPYVHYNIKSFNQTYGGPGPLLSSLNKLETHSFDPNSFEGEMTKLSSIEYFLSKCCPDSYANFKADLSTLKSEFGLGPYHNVSRDLQNYINIKLIRGL